MSTCKHINRYLSITKVADKRGNKEEEKVKTSHLGGCQAGRRSDGFLLPLIPLLIAVPLWFCLNQSSKQSKHGLA